MNETYDRFEMESDDSPDFPDADSASGSDAEEDSLPCRMLEIETREKFTLPHSEDESLDAERASAEGSASELRERRRKERRELAHELFRRIAVDRSELALQELYELMGSRTEAVIRQWVKSADEARDVLQETFVKIWNKAPQLYREDGNAYTLILLHAKHRAISRHRTRHATQAKKTTSYDGIHTEARYEKFFEDGQTPERDLDAKENQAELLRAMDMLEPRQRQVIDLIYFHNQTHEQVSKELGIPMGTISSLLRQAVAKMASVLSDRMGLQPPPKRKKRYAGPAW